MAKNETKEESFKRLSKKRTNRVLKDLKLIGNLSNKNNYSYTKENVKEMFNAIDKALNLSKNRFNVEMNKDLVLKIDYEDK